MATLNGEKFLEEQLTSIHMQTGVNVRIIANDDGSTDSTVEILESWKRKGLVAEIHTTKGFGPSRVFCSLIMRLRDEKFVAFADQDDVWASGKLETLYRIIDKSQPSLAFCERNYIDSDGKFIGKSQLVRKGTSFRNALIENVAPGNTVLLNSQALSLMKRYPPRDLIHFDAWLYLLISAIGVCNYTNLHLVNYRLHENNTVGLRTFNFRNFSLTLDSWESQARLLQDLLNLELNETVILQLDDFLELYTDKRGVGTVVKLLSFKFHRQKHIDAIAIKCLFFLRLLAGNQLWNRLIK